MMLIRKYLSIPFLCLFLLIFLLDFSYRFTLNGDEFSEVISDVALNANLSKPIFNQSELDSWLDERKKLKLADETVPEEVDPEVVEEVFDENSQQGELYSLIIDGVEYQFIASFMETDKLPVASFQNTELFSDLKFVTQGESFSGYLLENVGQKKVDIISPTNNMIYLQLFKEQPADEDTTSDSNE